MHNRGDALRILWYYVIPTIFMAKSDDDTVLLTVLKVFLECVTFLPRCRSWNESFASHRTSTRLAKLVGVLCQTYWVALPDWLDCFAELALLGRPRWPLELARFRWGARNGRSSPLGSAGTLDMPL